MQTFIFAALQSYLYMNDEQEPPREYPPFHERDDTIGVNDQFEMITKFAMEPNLAHYSNHDKLNHINKNLLFTNLRRQDDEPGKVVNQLKNITILKRFVKQREIRVPTGQYEQVAEDDKTITAREILAVQTVPAYRWNNLIDYFSTKLYGITSTSAGTDGKLLETLKSTFLHKEQSIEDKTQTTQSVWNSIKKKR